MTDINYPIVIAVVIAAIIFIVWLIRRNIKDEKDFEDDVIKSESAPEVRDKDGPKI